METAVWFAAGAMILVGFIGSIVPLLPGTTLILLGVLLQKWLLPETVSTLAIAWIAVAWLVSIVADIGCTVIGTKILGGGRWGMAGASGGALIGMFFSLPVLLLGTMLGAVVAEKWGAKRSDGAALKAGLGATVGFLLATVVRFICALAMVALYVSAAIAAHAAKT